MVAVREKSKSRPVSLKHCNWPLAGMPAWVDVNADKAEGVFKKVPDRDELVRISTNPLIVELYSR